MQLSFQNCILVMIMCEFVNIACWFFPPLQPMCLCNFPSHVDFPNLYRSQTWLSDSQQKRKHTFTAGTGLHTWPFVLLTLLLLDLCLFFLTVTATPTLVELPLREHLPCCTYQDRHYIKRTWFKKRKEKKVGGIPAEIMPGSNSKRIRRWKQDESALLLQM